MFTDQISNTQNELLIHKLFDITARDFPETTAVIFGEKSITYFELNKRAESLANVILNQTNDQEIIGISATRSIEMIIGLLAILKAGKAYLPLDPTYPEHRLLQIKEDSKVSTCISLSNEYDIFIKLELDVISSDKSYAETPLKPIFSQSENGCILYTSGSTGKPKGVCLGHKSLSNFLKWQKNNSLNGEGVKALQFCHLSFDASFQEIFVPLTTGSTLYLINDDYRLDGAKLLDFIISNDINKAFLPYVTLQYLTEAAAKEHIFPISLKELITGGELLKITHTIREFFSSIPNSCLVNVYGPTETTIWVTELRLTGNPENWESIPTIGATIAQSSIYFIDEELTFLENGKIGEICISGPCLSNGYLHQPELTDAKFIELSHSTKGQIKVYRTGDLGKLLENGEIEFGGRKDGQVKIRGNRVELGEIEVALMKEEEVNQAIVTLREDYPGRKTLIAYLTGNKATGDNNRLRHSISKLLPDYMIPSGFIWLEELPKTTSGKIDRKALPKPDFKRPELDVLYKSPGTQLEKDIAALFLDIFQYDKVGIEDNFFELGGNSLLAQKTVVELKYQFNYHLPITKLYQYPTVAGIAEFLENKTTAQYVSAKKDKNATNSQDVAIIGMAGRFPGAETINDLWSLLIEGRETTKFFTDDELDISIPDRLKNDSAYVKARGVIKDAEKFDPAFFGINPKLADLMDPQQRIFLEIAWEVLEKTGHLFPVYHKKIAVYAGSGSSTYYVNNLLQYPELIENIGGMQVLTVNEKDYIASRTAYHLNLKGQAVSVNSACSTSLLAVAEAVNSLRSGQCDAAIAGASSINTPINSGHIYQEGSMLSADGHCCPFDNDATGTVFSDGAGVVLLKRLADAEQDGDVIYAVIKGIGLNNDGSEKGSFTAPNADGQASAIEEAINDAGVAASEITYIETHGTGTPIGDPIEFDGLVAAFGPQDKTQFCAIGSIKSNFGHLTQAAGVTGLIKTCLSLYHKKLPASLGFKKGNKNIDFINSPFYVNTKLTDWNSDSKRVAGVSSFGVGGTNVHVVIQEYENPVPLSTPGRPYNLITCSAKSEYSREQYALSIADHLNKNKDIDIADIAYTLQKSRNDFSYRRFAIANTNESLVSLLSLERPKEGTTNNLRELPQEVVFTFPGQGAQYLNMASDLYKDEPVFKDSVDHCAEVLKQHINLDIREVIFTNSPNDQAEQLLKQTRYTQPALFVIEYALAKLWMNWGLTPTLLCGHSIGEYVAAHLSGVFSLEDGLKLIAVRGAMVNELPAGSMLSVRSEVDSITAILSEGLSIAAVNSPKLCVIAGPETQILKFSKLLETKEIPNKLLFTSHAFHSSMMDPIVDDFQNVVSKVSLSVPQIPIISTVTGKILTDEEAIAPEYWASHLRNTVQFSKAIDTILTYDNPVFLEVGPGSVTTTLVRQIAALKSTSIKAMQSLANNENDYCIILNTLGQLWNNGIQPNWDNFYKNQKRLFKDLPTYQFDRKKHWVNAIPLNKVTPNKTNNQNTNNPLVMKNNNLAVKIRQVLEDASGIEMENVGSNQNFLEIGLDSLLLTQIAISLKREFNLPITFRKLNEEYSTIELLTDYIGKNTIQETPVSVQNTPPIASENHQPVIAPVSLGNTNSYNDSALGLIAQQLEILSKQVLLMNGNNSPITNTVTNPIPVKSANPTQEQEPDLTPQEKTEIQKPFGATPKIDRQSAELSKDQLSFLEKLTKSYNEKTFKSKKYAEESRTYMADPRVVSGFKPLTKELIYPIVINKSSGSKLWDIDGNEYIDVLNGFGSNLLGYQPEVIKKAMHDQIENGYEVGPQHELAAEVSKLICEFTGFDRSALCSTGSEAVLGCIRIARTVTGRSLIVAFTGSYHGIIDEVLVRGTKKLKSFPAAAGIMQDAVKNILILDYGTDEALAIIKERADEIAAVIIEPIQSRRPEFVPIDFVKEVRKITSSSGSALIFDEVITGFRMHPGGAQALFNVRADLASYGKVVGAGIPIGVIAGKKEFMDALDGGTWNYGDNSYPEVGVTYFAGTFVRHPLALASAKASLLYMKEKGPKLQIEINEKGNYIAKTLNQEIEKRHLPFFVANYGSLWKVKFHEEIPYSELMFTLMREKGIHILDGFPCFVTEATSSSDIEQLISFFVKSMDEMIAAGFFLDNSTSDIISNDNSIVVSTSNPPVPGAKLGKDQQGNPSWFIADPNQHGKFLQIHIN
ncbi:polyketide synthase [Pedobacter foliorum]|uniref:polyketide synthase n=1 Tax=Pedobacter foliorum TaxID=2739058 RepID=UPI0015662839|nr:polyketide synthase [Pedobacter foliorum]NRF38224.1 amino acid adenylation domain-containing protein [Pedobacter foliorum]